MKILLAIGLLLAQLATPTWAGPSAYELDYSFARPLVVETRLVNGIFFNIISPKDRFANFEGVPYMAEMYADNYLMISGRTDGGLIETHSTSGYFSFDVMDEMEEKFSGNEYGYVVVKEWSGGQEMVYHIYATKEGFKEIVEVNRASDIYEVVAPNQLKLYVLNSDIEGLENCSRAERPHDQVIYTFLPNTVETERIKAEVPACTKDIWITVVSRFVGDKVYIDGQYRGSTTSNCLCWVTTISPGKHTVRVEKTGYTTFEQIVDVTKTDITNNEVSVVAELVPLMGHGTGTFPDGSEYVGEWKDGKRHGQGTRTRADGSTYIGEWQNDKEHGQGTFTASNGNQYVGQWQDGLPNGQGTEVFPDGTKFEGQYKDGKRPSEGSLTLPSGLKYVGEFKGNHMHGQGTAIDTDGRKISGEWKDGEPWQATEYDKNGNVISTWSAGVKTE